MNRRAFLRVSAMGGALAAVGSPSPAASPATRTAAPSASIPPFELAETTIAQLQQAMKSGRFTARSLTEMYRRRIEQLDRRGPALRAVLELNPDALSLADALDAERGTKGPRGPLHGIPILLKDNLDTADRMTTTAGSLALAGSIPKRDSFVARKLRAAGAILLGKTNLSEWANFRSSPSSSGWSGRGGQTRNPYALDRNPSGSSSGSAVAVAANMAAVAVGTETDGSIVSPSSINSVVGLKPTVGLVSRSGIIPIAHSQDTAGPMARTVADLAILLNSMVGPDPADPVTTQSHGRFPADYTRFLDPQGLRGARIGVARKLFVPNGQVKQLMDAALSEMKRLGAVLVDPVEIANTGQLEGAEFEVLLYEFKADLNAYLAGLGPAAPVRSLKEIIQFNERNPERELPCFGQNTLLRAEEKGPLTSAEYRAALEQCGRLSRAEGLDAALEKHRLAALVAPTTGPAWVTDLVNGDQDTGGCSTLAAVAGYPHLTVPLGCVFGLPVGLSFFGAAYSEPTLIQLAYAFEQATQARRPPRFWGHI